MRLWIPLGLATTAILVSCGGSGTPVDDRHSRANDPTATVEPTSTSTPVLKPLSTAIPTSIPIQIDSGSAELQKFVDERNKFSISVPSDWKPLEIDTDFFKDIVQAAAESIGLPPQGPQLLFVASDPIGSANMSVIAEVIDPTFSIDDLLEAQVVGLQAGIPEAVILETFQSPISGRSAGLFVYSMPGTLIDPSLAHLTTRSLAASIAVDGVGWTISCLTTDEDDASVIELCDSIVRSFEIDN